MTIQKTWSGFLRQWLFLMIHLITKMDKTTNLLCAMSLTLSNKSWQKNSIKENASNMFCSLITCSTCSRIQYKDQNSMSLTKLWEKERERERLGGEIYAKHSTVLLSEKEELFNIRPGLRQPDLVLVGEDGKPRTGEFQKGLELGRLEVPSKQGVQFPPHVCPAKYLDNKLWISSELQQQKTCLYRLQYARCLWWFVVTDTLGKDTCYSSCKVGFYTY